MSKFLAPIHTWLFNKILVLEEIEKQLLTQLATPAILLKRQGDLRELGDLLPQLPLEDMIDQNNIHGWLQDRITRAERRQARLVHHLFQDVEDAQNQTMAVYSRVAIEKAQQLMIEQNLGTQAPTLKDIYDYLGNVLLEGMPCDRVNRVIEASENRFEWATDHCVHQQNWAYAGVPVQIYYDFRASFTQAFATTLNPNVTYTYKNGESQIHTLTL